MNGLIFPMTSVRCSMTFSNQAGALRDLHPRRTHGLLFAELHGDAQR